VKFLATLSCFTSVSMGASVNSDFISAVCARCSAQDRGNRSSTIPAAERLKLEDQGKYLAVTINHSAARIAVERFLLHRCLPRKTRNYRGPTILV
jgi:hypothetical protein